MGEGALEAGLGERLEEGFVDFAREARCARGVCGPGGNVEGD